MDNRLGFILSVVVFWRRHRHRLRCLPVRGSEAERLRTHRQASPRRDRHRHRSRRLGVQHHGVGPLLSFLDRQPGGIHRHPCPGVVVGDRHHQRVHRQVVVGRVGAGRPVGDGDGVVLSVFILPSRDRHRLRPIPVRSGKDRQNVDRQIRPARRKHRHRHRRGRLRIQNDRIGRTFPFLDRQLGRNHCHSRHREGHPVALLA